MKKRVLTGAKVVADVDRGIRYARDAESYARQAEDLVKEFNDFVRDHRSMDFVNLSIEREYEEQCEHCHYVWEVDASGMPQCCDVAQHEHVATQRKINEVIEQEANHG